VIEENGGRGHAAPTPNKLGKGQEEEEVTTIKHVFILHNLGLPNLQEIAPLINKGSNSK
jgi:hypothetical protein